MNWKQIREMTNNSGVTIGHHTKNHFHLVSYDKETVIKEIEEANNDFLENELLKKIGDQNLIC